MNRTFRKYHRTLALLICLPLALTVLTGMAYTIAEDWVGIGGELGEIILGIHTGEIAHLEAIYPILNGLGITGLLVTGLSMSGLFGNKRQRNPKDL